MLGPGWRSGRELNTVADDITNSVFTQVDMAKRIPMSHADIPTSIIHALWETKQEFDELRAEAKAAAVPGERKRKRQDKTPW